MKRLAFGLLTLAAVILAVLCICYARLAHAAGTVAHVSWTLPDTYSDNTPMPASDVKEVVLVWSRPNGGPQAGVLHIPSPALSVDIPGLPCGDYEFKGSLVTTAGAAIPNAMSDASNVVPYATGISCKPNPLKLTAS